MKKIVLLMILDGWGYSTKTGYNAIYHAKTPTFDNIWNTETKTLLQASGKYVGLPDGQMGNSEVGHTTIGSGRIIFQNLVKINNSIKDGTLNSNETLLSAIKLSEKNKKNIHVIGLLSDGGVHSHVEHIIKIIQICSINNNQNVYIHCILDGRDVPPCSAMKYLNLLNDAINHIPNTKIISIIGRYYAMDRDNNIDRIQKSFDLMVNKKYDFNFNNQKEALDYFYQKNITDEFIPSTVIGDYKNISITDNDCVIFCNFRADRAKQLANYLKNESNLKINLVTMTKYDSNIKSEIIFKSNNVINTLGKLIADNGKKQLRISETEKYAHVTFFMNGGKEEPFDNEKRILIKSPNVATYDLQPQMSCQKLTDTLIESIQSQKYDFIICNYPNADMVGHTGDFKATIKAIEALDHSIKRVLNIMDNVAGETLITADHGNADVMYDTENNTICTSHTNNPVPFIHIGSNSRLSIKNNSSLADIAPTILNLFNIEKPQEMSGNNILKMI